MTRTLTPDELRAVGTALWGDRWQSEMSRAWQVNDRTVRSWASGRMTFPHARIADLLDLAHDRIDDIQAIRAILDPIAK